MAREKYFKENEITWSVVFKKKVLNQILLNLIEGEETEIKKLLNFKWELPHT